MAHEYIIEINDVVKKFRIYHEKRNTIFEQIVSLTNKRKYYEELTVLNEISFKVKKGETFGIVGLNGSGKSTLLKLIAGIIYPDRGTIRTKGSIVPILELGAGFHPDLTAKDNIIVYGMVLGFSKSEIIKKVERILEFAELKQFADTKIKNFSSGMHARLAFSTAIQVDPDILLVDEVLSVGDLPFQEKSFKAFSNFKKQGKTIIFVTHGIGQVSRLCDRALFLHEGKIRKIGSPNEIVNEFYKIAEQKILDTADHSNSSSHDSDSRYSIVNKVDPTAVVVNNNTNIAYISCINSDFIVVIDCIQNEIIGYIEVEAAPRDMAFNSNNNTIYIVNRDSNSVSIIDGYTNKMISSIKTGERPRGVQVNVETGHVYIANRDSNSLDVIDGTALKIIARIIVGSGPQGITIDPYVNRIYVANSASNSISVINGNTNGILANIPVENNPTSIAINTKTNKIYVTNRDSNTVSVLSGKDNKVIDRIVVGNSPFGITIDEEDNIIYVTNSGDNSISKIDGSNNKVSANIPVGNFPLGIAINANTKSILVANQAADSISIVDGRTGALVSTIVIPNKNMYLKAKV